MGIDGINKPGGGPKIDLGSTQGSESKFEVGQRTDSTIEQSDSVETDSALQQLNAGTLSIDAYLDLQVSQAVKHLEGKLPPEQLDFVRQTLREQLTEDPVLVELVRRTTSGAMPAGSAGNR